MIESKHIRGEDEIKMQSFNSQFAHPRGAVGSLAGTIMAYENRARNRWAISLLEIKSNDHILEVGFGPGWAIQQMAQIARDGFIAGIDASQTMVEQASRRNVAAIREGRVRLERSPADAIPYPDNHFDKALAVNSLHIWSDASAGLQELRRVLKPGGRLVVTIQPVWAKTDAAAQQIGDDLLAQFKQAGLQQVRLETKSFKPLAVSAIGVK